MKLRTVFLLTIGFTLLAVGATFPLVLFAADSEPGYFVLSTLAILPLFIVPALAISFGAAWREPTDPAGRATVRRTHAVLGIIFGIGVVGTAVAGVLTPAASPYLIVVVAVAVGLSVCSFVLAGRLRRRNRETGQFDEPWQVVPRGEIARKVRAMILTFAITLLAGLVVIAALAFSVLSGDEDLLPLLLFPLVFAFIAAGLAGLYASFAYLSTLRSVLGGDVTLTKRVGRVVLRRKAERLEGDDLVRAARWASIMAVHQPLQAAGSLSNLIGIGLIQVTNILFPSSDGFFRQLSVVFVVVFGVLIAGTIPLYVRQIRRLRAFAREHQDLLIEDPVPS